MSEPVGRRRWAIADGYPGYPDIGFAGSRTGPKRAAAAGGALVAGAAALA